MDFFAIVDAPSIQEQARKVNSFLGRVVIPLRADNAHRKLDAAVCAAYGWLVDLSDDEILARLLALNLARATG